MHTNTTTAPIRTYGSKQAWGRKERKAESKNRRASSKRAWKAEARKDMDR